MSVALQQPLLLGGAAATSALCSIHGRHCQKRRKGDEERPAEQWNGQVCSHERLPSTLNKTHQTCSNIEMPQIAQMSTAS